MISHSHRCFNSILSQLIQKRYLSIAVGLILALFYILWLQTKSGTEICAECEQIQGPPNNTVDHRTIQNRMRTTQNLTNGQQVNTATHNITNSNSKTNTNTISEITEVITNDISSSDVDMDVKSCYLPISTTPSNDITLFEDIFAADKKPTLDRSIFFIETTCVRNGLAHLTARQACAIESAARLNPQRDIFVLFVANVGFSDKLSSRIMKYLRFYPNIYYRRINFIEFAAGTPAQEFFKTDKIFQSSFLIETFSDVLRLLTLYRFGGVYLDLDTVVQKNLDVLPPNFAGREIGRYIANGVIGFNHAGSGHELVGIIIKDVCDNFDPTKWGNTGPHAVTRSLERVCNETAAVSGALMLRENMTPENCMGFHVLDEKTFYPIYGTEWERLFDAHCTAESLQQSNDSILVHFWNKLSSCQPILKDFKNETLVKMYRDQITRIKNIRKPIGETAYGVIAKKNCPRAYESSGDLF